MNRRNFITGIGALVGGLALDKAIPFNRVWSFPSKIVIPNRQLLGRHYDYIVMDDLVGESRLTREQQIALVTAFKETDKMNFYNKLNLGFSTIKVPDDVFA